MANIIQRLAQVVGLKLGAVEKRNVIRSMLPGALEEGYNGNEALKIFKQNGLGIREGDYWGIWREVKGIEEQAQRVKFVRKDANVNPDLFGDLLREQDEDYFFVGRYQYYDEDKDKFVSGIYGMATNTLGQRGEIEERLLDQLRSAYGQVGANQVEMNLVRAYKRD